MPDESGTDMSVILEDFSTLKSITADLINENAELKNALEVKERELALIYTLNRKITFSMEWDEIQEMVVELIMDFFPVVRFCMIALYGDDNELTLKIKGGDDPVVSNRLRVNTDIDETSQWDEIVATEEWNSYFSGIDFIKSLQSSFIPLAFNHHQMGFLMICKHKNVQYDKDEWRFLSTIANYVGMVLDNSRLDKISRTDSLTGLYNRWFFSHRLNREVARATRDQSSLSIFMIDIDHFKKVNDTYGHPAGDQVLVQLSKRIRDFAERGEQVFRIGGEEIVLLLPDLEKNEAASRAEELRKIIADRPFVFGEPDSEISKAITVSIGVATFPTDAADEKELFSMSDQAMYRAKSHGRNKVAVARWPL
ncbi:diguanylate cyclase [bacterium]